MKTGQIITATLVAVMAVSIAASVQSAEMPTEPRGGQPPKGSKPSVKNFTEQVTYQRAFETVVWSMPAMIKYGMRRASLEIGAGDNGYSKGPESGHQHDFISNSRLGGM